MCRGSLFQKVRTTDAHVLHESATAGRSLHVTNMEGTIAALTGRGFPQHGAGEIPKENDKSTAKRSPLQRVRAAC